MLKVVALHSPEYEKFVIHTPESFNAGVDELKTLSDSGRRAQVITREKELGIEFDPHCVLWDSEIRAFLRPMSHGLNGFVLHLE